MSTERKMSTGAREAIRIAERFVPDDLERQRDLAREIVGAIGLCEAEFAAEIVRSLHRAQGLSPLKN